jgi:hypothetical protein
MARRCKHIEELYDPLATILIGASRFRAIVTFGNRRRHLLSFFRKHPASRRRPLGFDLAGAHSRVTVRADYDHVLRYIRPSLGSWLHMVRLHESSRRSGVRDAILANLAPISRLLLRFAGELLSLSGAEFWLKRGKWMRAARDAVDGRGPAR